MENLGGKIARGAAWIVTIRMAVRGLGLISTLILARLLIPQDFGLVALAMSLYFMVELLGNFSFDSAIIQRQHVDRTYYDTAWTLNTIYGFVSAAALIALAVPAAHFFGEPRLTSIIYVLAGISFFSRLENVAIVDFRKELQMHKLFWLQVPKKFISFLTTITIAFLYRSYWALVAGICAGAAVRVVSTYIAHPFRPRFNFSRFHELFGFSRWLLLSSLFGYANRRSANLIIGKVVGASSLGLYSISHELSNLTSTELALPISHALFPGYSKIASNLSSLKWYYLKTFSLMAFIALPIGAGLSVIAWDMVDVVLGEKWLEAAPLIRTLAIAGIFSAINTPNDTIFMATGRPHLGTALGGFRMTLLIGLLLLTVPSHGALGAAFSQLALSILMTPISASMVARHLHVGLTDFAKHIWRPMTATLIMIAGVVYIHYALAGALAALRLPLEVTAGSIAYTLIAYSLWCVSGRPDGAESYIIRRLKDISLPLSKAQKVN